MEITTVEGMRALEKSRLTEKSSGLTRSISVGWGDNQSQVVKLLQQLTAAYYSNRRVEEKYKQEKHQQDVAENKHRSFRLRHAFIYMAAHKLPLSKTFKADEQSDRRVKRSAKRFP